MKVSNADIDSLRKEIAKTSETIDVCCANLGKAAFHFHSEISYEPSDDAFQRLSRAFVKNTEINGKIEAFHEAENQKSAENMAIVRAENSVNDINSKIKTLTSSLGAVAYEAYNTGNLADSLLQYTGKFAEFDRKTSELTEKLSQAQGKVKYYLAQRSLQKHKNTISEIFYETGKLLLAEPETKFAGDKFLKIVNEVSVAREDTDRYLSVISRKSDAGGSITDTGNESKVLKTLETERRKSESELEVLYFKYGKSLADGMQNWLTPALDQGILKCCALLKNEYARLQKQNLRQEYLLAEREIDILTGENSQMISQLEHLGSQRDLIDRQIAQIRQKIEDTENSIKGLKEKENNLSRQAAEIGTSDIL